MDRWRFAAWQVYLAVCAVAGVVYYAFPAEWVQATIVAGVGMSAAVAIVAGVRRHKPAVRWPWYLMAAARACFALAEVAYWIQHFTTGGDVFPSYVDVLYLTFAVLLAISVVGLVRARRPGRDRPGLIDALVLSTGAAMLAWVFLIVPYVRAEDLSPLARAVSLAYPISDLLVLTVLSRLVTGKGDRPPAFKLLVASIAALLYADIGYALLELSIGYTAGNIVDLGWIAMQALGGAAALHPSVRALAERSPQTAESPAPRRRVAALAVASLMAPAVLAIEWLRGMPIDVPVIVAGCTVLFLLVIARLDGLVRLLAGALRAVEEQATTDQLTGLANRRRFHDRWAAALGESVGPTALLYIDLDGFKPVNDTCGHEAGDAVLVAVAQRINTIVRTGDVVARLGGDEFAVILPWTDDETAKTVADRIVAALSEPFDTPARPVYIGASIGVITACSGANPETELRRADTAMYTAKNNGRNRVHHDLATPDHS
ncbi:GGDEF domain-containing protein [Paractinoplanes lichenicola]|uniref:GGDEF domain-containing protein n=1 Tax=Paractinoplanes lichenicola TaxID=2802976 RepID=A0ABS1VM15_9ACTN|nr:GGDEF domain-containing protein [Actinoplanes lichenicola]MBL7255693.1 GGDEF domain-containing protein [Actinoplanes lichenicola]